MIQVLQSALKHGLQEDEVVFAWQNVFEFRRRSGNKLPAHYLALGTLPCGKLVELVAYSTGCEWVIFHAMSPPTPGVMKEFERR